MALQISGCGRTESILLIKQRADGDVVDPAERLGELERGNGRGTDKPFRAEDDGCGVWVVYVGRYFGGDLVDAWRNADVRHTP